MLIKIYNTKVKWQRVPEADIFIRELQEFQCSQELNQDLWLIESIIY